MSEFAGNALTYCVMILILVFGYMHLNNLSTDDSHTIKDISKTNAILDLKEPQIKDVPIDHSKKDKKNVILYNSIYPKNNHFIGNVSDDQVFYIKRLPWQPPMSIFELWSTVCITIKSNKPCFISEGLMQEEIETQEGLGAWLSRVITKFHVNAEKEVCDTYLYVPYIYKDYYIRVETYEGLLEVEYVFKQFDLRLFIFFVAGICLFVISPELSKSEIFYYTSGVSVGLVGSILLIFLLIAKYIPKKKIAILTGLTGTSIWFYITKWFKDNINELNSTCQNYLIIYLVSAGLISMIILYTQGPITNPRYTTVIERCLQLFAIGLFYYGVSERKLVMALLVAVTVIGMIYRLSETKEFRQFVNRFWPKKRKLLTRDEYTREADEFTQRQLNELKTFCQSPVCDPWRLMSRLKSPEKFARFVKGKEGHLSDDELSLYDTYNVENDLMDQSENDSSIMSEY